MSISQTASQSERSRSRRRDGGRSTSRRARGRHQEASPHADALDDTLPEIDWDEVMHLGKQFLVVGELWFLPSYDDFFKKPRTNLDLFDSRRFRVIQPEKLVPWTIEELYVWVPDVYHNLLEKYDDFKNVVSFKPLSSGDPDTKTSSSSSRVTMTCGQTLSRLSALMGHQFSMFVLNGLRATWTPRRIKSRFYCDTSNGNRTNQIVTTPTSLPSCILPFLLY